MFAILNQLSIDEFEEKIRSEGLIRGGFGFIHKVPMADPDLTLESKAVYAYFCSWDHNEYPTEFPGRETILADLRISEGRYYRYFAPLTEQGYITPWRWNRRGQEQDNMYIIESMPLKYIVGTGDPKKIDAYDEIRTWGLRPLGHGVIPKAVMRDPRLTIQAKGIYAYFASDLLDRLDVEAPVRLPDILEHLRISASTYYRHYRLLTDLDYVTAVQQREGGNIYVLNDYPDQYLVRRKSALRLL